MRGALWFPSFVVLPAFCAFSLSAVNHPSLRLPELYIAGDSTAAKDDGSPELLGWGEKIGQYLSIPVVNDAVSGATTRTYTGQGYCAYLVVPPCESAA